MKRRDLEDLKRQQSQKQQKVRDKYKFILLGIGAIALLGGIIYLWKELPRILLRNQVAADCKKIDEAWNTLSTYLELDNEAKEKGTFALVRKKPIDNARLYQIADLMDAEYERMKTFPIKDLLLSRYYLMFLDSIKLNAIYTRQFAKEPSLKIENPEIRQLSSNAVEGSARVAGRCQGMTDEEIDRAFKQEVEKLRKQIEQSTKEFNEKQK